MTVRENFLATIRGEKAERFVDQYGYMHLIFDPVMWEITGMPFTMKPGERVVNGWGVTVDFPEGAPGPLPIHNDELTVLKDITEWREVVKAPNVVLGDAAWADAVAEANSVNRDDALLACFTAPGIFEKLHYLMGMEETFVNFYDEPEEMMDLINFMADWEIELAKEQIKYLHPDVVFHHDDWGSHISSLLSPEMFDEFLLPAYQRVYGFYKENGCLIVHHSDSYGANLVPSMIKMGIDVWQGCLSTNNLPELIKQYGGQISFQGGIDSTKLDHEGWSREEIRKEVESVCRACGTKYFIPSNTMGGPGSIYPGVYEAISEEIARMSREMF